MQSQRSPAHSHSDSRGVLTAAAACSQTSQPAAGGASDEPAFISTKQPPSFSEHIDQHIAAASTLLGEQGSALDEYAQLYEYAGDLAGEVDQLTRQKQAYLLAAAQWAIMNYDKRAKEVELKFPKGV